MNRNIYSKLGFLAVLLALSSAIFMPVGVYADMVAPNSTSISGINVWRNVITTNDTFVMAKYEIVYNPIPAVAVDSAFIFQLFDASDTVELGTVTAYNYQNYGYGQGVVAWYFPSGSAPVWGSALVIRVQGTPYAFSSPPITKTQIPTTAYSPLTDTDLVKADIGIKVISMADDIGKSWTPTYALTEVADTGTKVLSTLGSAYFKAAIPGLESIAPAIFFMQKQEVSNSTIGWANSTADNYSQKINGTNLGDDINSIANFFGTSFSVMAMLPVIIACIVMIIIGALQGQMLSGVLNSSVIITASSWGGWFPPMVGLGIIPFACAVYIFYHLAFKSG